MLFKVFFRVPETTIIRSYYFIFWNFILIFFISDDFVYGAECYPEKRKTKINLLVPLKNKLGHKLDN